MPLHFSTTDVLGAIHGVKALAYGRTGTGKTRLCATAPTPMIFSAESGLLALRKYRINCAPINTMMDLLDAYRWASSSDEARLFESVCIDSISEIGEVLLSSAKTQYKDPRQAYGELLDRAVKVIRDFRDLPGKHVYVTAKLTNYVDAVSGRTFFGPSMPGQKLGPQLPYYFDLVMNTDVGITETGEKYFYVRTQSDIQYDAKDRSGALDPIERPDLSFIINKITGVMK